MLTKIREKAQGVFAWVILLLITVPFALWGIQNYMDAGKEAPVVSVGDKDFYQRDVGRAYAQFSQNLQGLGIDEETLKQQSLQKLIRDEVLLQYVKSEGLVITDQTARDFIKSLDYFQVDGQFDKKQYQALLNSQGMSSAEFIGRIKNALTMEQFQHSITDSSYATAYDIESFFKIQNQQRDIEYTTFPVPKLAETPADDEVDAYYQQHLESYQTPELVTVDYVELSLAALAKEVEATDKELLDFYEEQKDLYTQKERRKISHILFSVNDEVDDEAALAKAQQAKTKLQEQDFAQLAEALSDDKLSAKNGGDLGLLQSGVMEKEFEDAALALQLGEVSEPVKSSFGYHLIKVTELVPGATKTFAEVKDDVKKAFQKTQAENRFYELGETLAEMSYENSDSLLEVADAMGVKIQRTGIFSRDKGEGIASEPKIRNAAFSEEVLNGTNSEPIELNGDRIVVLRLNTHQPAATRALDEVKQDVVASLLKEKAKKQVEALAITIKSKAQAGESLQELAEMNSGIYREQKGLARSNTQMAPELIQAVFKAEKPAGEKPTILSVALANGDQAVVRLNKVQEGVMSDEDKKRMDLASKNIAKAFGQTLFNSVMTYLEKNTDISAKSN